MKKILLIPVLILVSIISHSQFVHKIKADSVLITNDSCTAELNLENATKNVNGFLYNKGNGRTEFRKGLIKINDSLYIIGSDTLNIAKSGNYIQNQTAIAQTANAWIDGSVKIGADVTTYGNKLKINGEWGNWSQGLVYIKNVSPSASSTIMQLVAPNLPTNGGQVSIAQGVSESWGNMFYQSFRYFGPNHPDNGVSWQIFGKNHILTLSNSKILKLDGRFSIGTTASNALLHLGGGIATANAAPLKFTSGTNLTTPENGAVEYDGTNYFVTSNETRYTLARTLTTTSVLNFNNTSAGSSTDLTITIAGAANGDAVSLGVPNEAVSNNGLFSAWVSAANTITVRFSNNDLTTAIDPASGTFRVSIIKY